MEIKLFSLPLIQRNVLLVHNRTYLYGSNRKVLSTYISLIYRLRGIPHPIMREI